MAPEIFQKIIYEYFGDIPNVVIYFDDLLVCTNSLEEHDDTLLKVIQKARSPNVKFNKSKLQFRVREVSYLGHVCSRDGMKIDPNKVEAIKKITAPNSKKELQKLLGFINYI